MVITSLANATVKMLASLRVEKYRAEHGLFIVEGPRTIAEAHQAGAVPKILVHVENGESLAPIAGVKQACLGAGGTVLAVTPEVMAKITHKQNPQGAAAAYAIPRRGFADIKPAQNDLYVALDRI
ncbi:MAG: hypothetical protein JNK21_07535, partial [Rhodospirillaceae bacterium]|nr:hypothetical protein [Rhodospirillaceae bacterium]